MAVPQREREAILKCKAWLKSSIQAVFPSRHFLNFEAILHILHVANNVLKCQTCASSPFSLPALAFGWQRTTQNYHRNTSLILQGICHTNLPLGRKEITVLVIINKIP